MAYSPEQYRAHFFEVFRGKAQFIKDFCSERKVESVILTCCAIDALSVYKFGEPSSGRKFVNFTLQYSGLQETYEKVSLPVLKENLRPNPKKKELPPQRLQLNSKIAKLLENKFGVIEDSYTQLDYNVDVSLDKLIDKVAADLNVSEQSYLKKIAIKYRYITLLWREYRCNAIHKSTLMADRALMNLAEKEVPYYGNEIISENGVFVRHIPRFDIPPKFMISTLENCIMKLESEWNHFNVNPMDL
jgi:hypothetical protein